MIGVLPQSLNVKGIEYDINSDYRNVLVICEAFNDSTLTDHEKAYICMKRLFKDPESIPSRDLQKAVEMAFWFVGGGDIPKSEPSKTKLIDWKHDESIIFPAVNKVCGCEVRAVPYMHWWTFIGYFGEIGEGLFSTVMNIRHKRAEGKKLEKWEREFLRKHKELVILRTDEERQAIDETEEFLKTIT